MKLLVLIFINVALAAYYEDLVDRVQKNLKKEKTAKWKAGYNKRFAGMSKESLAKLAGTIMIEDDNSSSATVETMSESTLATATIASTFDARNVWPKCSYIGYIRDQSCCGSCWVKD